MTKEVTMDDIRQQLHEVEDRLRSLRQEKARATKVREAARAVAVEAPEGDEGAPQFEAAQSASKAVQDIDGLIEKATDQQTALLRKLGDIEAGRSGFSSPGVSGWETAARKLDLASGELRVDVPARSLLAQTLPPSPTSPTSPLRRSASVGVTEADLPSTSNRWLFPVFSQQPFGATGADLVTTDFVLTFSNSQLTGGLTGGIERDPDSTATKAKLTPTVVLAYPQAKQYAAILDNVPSKVFDSQAAVRALLGTELARQLSERFDEACVDALEAANPPHSSTGTDLIQKIRHGISSMHDLGGSPSVIGLSAADAASLDLATDGTSQYIFIPATTGQQVVWRLLVREVPTIAHPTLVDPGVLGVSYLGEGSVLLNPYDGMDTNVVKARVEIEGLALHVRCVQQGAYQIY
jgi:hypothetical protein